MNTAKPTVTPITGADHFIVSFPGCTRTAQINPVSGIRGAYEIHVNGQVSTAFNDEDALCNAWVACADAPAALSDKQVMTVARKFIDTSDKTRDEMLDALAALEIKTYAKVVRAMVKARIGRAYSVRISTGTAYGWIHITSRPSSKNETEDKVLLSKILGGQFPTFQHDRSIACQSYKGGDYRASLAKIAG
jgi:hypothetical protein